MLQSNVSSNVEVSLPEWLPEVFRRDERTWNEGVVVTKVISKTLPTDPWSIPQTPNQQFMVRNSFHLGVKGDVWGMLQGYVGFPLDDIVDLICYEINLISNSI